MSSGLATPPTPKTPLRPRFTANIWNAPLVPVALALTAGILLDRAASIPVTGSLLVSLLLLIAWAITSFGREQVLSLVYLWGGVAALGAAYHHWHREGMRDDDIGRFASAEPVLVYIRGVVRSEPVSPRISSHNPLRAFPEVSSTRFVLDARALQLPGGWQAVSGRVQVTVNDRSERPDLDRDDEPVRHLERVQVGDLVECFGRLTVPEPPGNPGEFDYAAHLRDQGVHAVFLIRGKSATMRVLELRGPIAAGAWLAAIGDWCKRILDESLPPAQAAVARALLLGDGSAMTGDDWEKYLRTGVIHVLAISGQHLVVLGAFAWLVLRLFGVRRRTGAIVVALFLIGYAVLVGARPPVMRAAWMVTILCGGMLLQRPVLPANSFALAWILVIAWNPADAFNSGCLLSFLAVAMLIWGIGQWRTRANDPLEALIEESRPPSVQMVRQLGSIVLWSYLVNLAVWLAVTPLVADRFHLVSPVAILIGSPMVLLTSIALLAGFLLLISSAIFWPIAPLFALVTSWSLAGCDMLVTAGVGMPGAYCYVADIPAWWLWPFYLGLLVGLTVETFRRRWVFGAVAATAWLGVGLIIGLLPRSGADLRCTFLAVGHGGCTVLETPDGRTLLYDAGAITGPDVTRRQIAPFLWSRGITRVDEIFISHADLDHFNGMPALAERFGIGQVSCTPTFSERDAAGVGRALQALQRHGIPVRTLKSGDRLLAGSVKIDVLHPPALGPEGTENARSLVLQIEHAGHTFVLTGDLESPGLEQVMALPGRQVDVFMAPHHGSRFSNTLELARWAGPKIVVSSQGRPRFEAAEPYTARGSVYLPTWTQGAVTIRSSEGAMVVETFRSGQKWILD